MRRASDYHDDDHGDGWGWTWFAFADKFNTCPRGLRKHHCTYLVHIHLVYAHQTLALLHSVFILILFLFKYGWVPWVKISIRMRPTILLDICIKASQIVLTHRPYRVSTVSGRVQVKHWFLESYVLSKWCYWIDGGSNVEVKCKLKYQIQLVLDLVCDKMSWVKSIQVIVVVDAKTTGIKPTYTIHKEKDRHVISTNKLTIIILGAIFKKMMMSHW